jgi:hypothetical protein
MINPATRRISFATSVAVAASLALGASTAPASLSSPPAPAVTRLTALGFSAPQARRLLLTMQTAPAGAAGAYAAQRIAMATLYGGAIAFGGPRYRPAG